MGIQSQTKVNTSSSCVTLVIVSTNRWCQAVLLWEISTLLFLFIVTPDGGVSSHRAQLCVFGCRTSSRGACGSHARHNRLADSKLPFLLFPRSTSSRESDITLIILAKKKKKKHGTKMQVVHPACVRLVMMRRAAADWRLIIVLWTCAVLFQAVFAGSRSCRQGRRWRQWLGLYQQRFCKHTRGNPAAKLLRVGVTGKHVSSLCVSFLVFHLQWLWIQI